MTAPPAHDQAAGTATELSHLGRRRANVTGSPRRVPPVQSGWPASNRRPCPRPGCARWWSSARRVGRHELIDRGAALTYYSVLSLIPGLLVLFSVIGLFGRPGHGRQCAPDLQGRRAVATARRPPGSRSKSLLKNDTQSGVLLGTGLLAVLWTASAYIGSFFRASATIWGVERRPAWRAWPLRMALTVAILILLALALLLIASPVSSRSPLGDALGIGEAVLDVYGFPKWPALLVVVTLLVGILYRSSPSGERHGHEIGGC